MIRGAEDLVADTVVDKAFRDDGMRGRKQEPPLRIEDDVCRQIPRPGYEPGDRERRCDDPDNVA